VAISTSQMATRPTRSVSASIRRATVSRDFMREPHFYPRRTRSAAKKDNSDHYSSWVFFAFLRVLRG
jgi:hypothetical protein